VCWHILPVNRDALRASIRTEPIGEKRTREREKGGKKRDIMRHEKGGEKRREKRSKQKKYLQQKKITILHRKPIIKYQWGHAGATLTEN
jgi:hypothetical protein